MSERSPAKFRRALLGWYERNRRDLPWRRTSDPWAIHVSEIMLQQTRVAAVLPYYERFMARYPTPAAFARVSESETLACWAGLGYYSRARNLQKAAVRIALSGEYPRDHADIRALPGVGDYTAAAIGSIAFGHARAAVDGNVLRVFARITAEKADLRARATQQRLTQTARALIDPRRPGDFNQALMELGATVCLPRNPLCLVCPLSGVCAARESGRAAELPVKLRKQEPVRISGELLVIEKRGRILLRQREPEASRMAGFWDLPAPADLPRVKPGARLGEIRHTITHHRYTLAVRRADAAGRLPAGFRWFAPAELNSIPFSTTARKALRLAGLVYKL